MAISNTHIKQLELGTDQYYISAKYLLDNSNLEHSYEDIKQLIDAAAAMHNLEIRVVASLPTASVDTLNAIYLVEETGTQSGVYVEYITVKSGSSEPYTYTWEKIGTTATDLSEYSLKTHIHTVTPNSMSIGATAVNGSITFNTSKALGTNATFTTTVTPTTTNIKATASGAALSTSDADFVNGVTSNNANFINSVSSTNSNFLSSWGAAVDANGVLSFSTASDSALTGVSTTNASALTGVSTTANKALISASVSTQPTISLGTGTGTGTVSVATGITSATTTTNSHDEVSAYTSVNVFTQPTIKINNADSVNVAAPTQVNTSSDTTA